MRLFSVPPPTLLAGFLAVLIGYASSAAIIWQAAIVAGATTAQISGWMTALGLALQLSCYTAREPRREAVVGGAKKMQGVKRTGRELGGDNRRAVDWSISERGGE